MLCRTYASALLGIDAVKITVEVNSSRGLDFTLVGLPDSSVKESRERIASALHFSGYHFPNKSIVINMAPADIKKEGASFDLPLAVAMLAADEQLTDEHLSEYMIMGELSLDGTLQPIRGVLPMALCAKQNGFRGVIIPEANAYEAAVVSDLDVIGAKTLSEVVGFLNGQQPIEPLHIDPSTLFTDDAFQMLDDFSDVRGQQQVRRALEVAAAGGHNILMVGPPGAGKSMMAKRLPSILPPLSLPESLETTKVHSVAGLMARRHRMNTSSSEKGDVRSSLIIQRPFRAPHHTITDVALVGGGNNPQPGEISLAHNGVLFLDELPEYKRSALEVMRQPLEDHTITIARAKNAVTYPASFMLVAAMNPCPCGHFMDPSGRCTCTPAAIHRYLSKLSGPLLDRIDIQVPIQSVSVSELQKAEPGESSAAMRERVVRARQRQLDRFASEPLVHCNAQMASRHIRRFCRLSDECQQVLSSVVEKQNLSARAYDRILRVARTIADIEGAEQIRMDDLLEAISYRELDKERLWL